jgi:hypothetical protein
MIMTACEKCGYIRPVYATNTDGIAITGLHQFGGEKREFRCLNCITGQE